MCGRVCQCSRLDGKYMSTIRMREKALRERLLYKVTYTNMCGRVCQCSRLDGKYMSTIRYERESLAREVVIQSNLYK